MKPRGFTRTDLIVVVFSVGLVLWYCWPRLHGDREISYRAVCVANVRGIGRICKIYANDFNDWWPIAPHDANDFAGLSPIGKHRDDGNKPHRDPSIGQSLWLLVRGGGVTLKQFTCPEKGCTDTPAKNQNPLKYYDFPSGSNLSYGYQFPYEPSAARPRETLDPNMPMLADKCFVSVGAAIRSGKDADFNKWSPEAWRPHNSKHAFGETNCVLYLDEHVVTEKKPACGARRSEFPRGTPYVHADLIYENADGVGGGEKSGWPLDERDSVIVHDPWKAP